MKDGIIKAEGNSRLARSVANFKEKYPTYDDFANALMAGTLPLDILFHAEGWAQIPDFLNQANLLKETTAALYGKDNTAVPDDVLAILSKAILNGDDGYTDVNGIAVPQVKIATGSYVGTGTYGASNPCSLTFDFVPKIGLIAGLGSGYMTTSYDVIKCYCFLMIESYKNGVALSSRSAELYAKFSESTLSWYTTTNSSFSPYDQHNNAGTIYSYIFWG